MLAAGNGGEKRIKRNDSGDFTVGDLEAEADMFENGFGKIPEKILSGLEDRDKSAVGLLKAIDHKIEASEHFFFGGFAGATGSGALRRGRLRSLRPFNAHGLPR
jgi:hypothetical protein